MTLNEITNNEIENKLAYVLARVYRDIPWNKIHISNAHKFFIDRIRASTNTKTFKEYLDVLTRKCNVEIIKIDTNILDFLDENSHITMRLLRNETLYICNLALETVEELKKKG